MKKLRNTEVEVKKVLLIKTACNLKARVDPALFI